MSSIAPTGFGALVAGRRTKWLMVVVWVGLVVGLGSFAGNLGDVQENDAAAWLPESAESTEAQKILDTMPDADVMPAVVVFERAGGLTAVDRAAVQDIRSELEPYGVQALPPVTSSDDGEAALVIVPLSAEEDGLAQLDEIEQIAERAPPGLTELVTGPAGLSEAFNSAFDGVEGALFLAAAAVVTVLLLLIYRSPVLWILPVISAAVATVLSMAVVALLAEHVGLTVNGQSAGILPVLVFGAATDYALLLLARYREELHHHEDRHAAMTVALHRSGPAILASAATVALGMLCLLAAELTSNKGLGPVAAVGVICALAVITTLLPALLVVCGRWVFWPVRPHQGTPVKTVTSIWGRIGRRTSRRPRLVWIVTAVVLGGVALATLNVRTGLDYSEQLTGEPEAVVGQEVIGEHFPQGQALPAHVVARAGTADEVAAAAAEVPGVGAVLEPKTSTDGSWVDLPVALDSADPDEYGPVIEDLREAVHAVPGAGALVGGDPAATYDVAEASAQDRAVVPVLVLGVILLVLVVLLRSLVAPLLLVATVVLSYGAAAGASWLLFDHVLGFAGVDESWLILTFVLLVALGVDYNIFLAHRSREEVGKYGHHEGIIRGLASTGGVITSAGVVLAATFGVLALVPLTMMTEMGVMIALGVAIDTFIVRTLLVPMLAVDVGERFWWPSRPAAHRDDAVERELAETPVHQ